MFNTGFTMNAKKMAEKMDGPTLTWMRDLSAKKDAVITGSLIIEDQAKYYNRLIWMQPDGECRYYNKRHLFRMSEENHIYTQGHDRLIVDWRGWKICPMICYDLRFPVWCRNRNDYDLLIYVANWPERRNYPWKQLLIARAIENISYVAGVNRIGEDGNSIYHSGDTAIIDYKGEVVSHTKPHEENIETLQLSMESLKLFRENFPAWKDADEFLLQ